MASTSNSTDSESALQNDATLNLALTVMSAVGVAGCSMGVVSKLTFRYVIPVAWKCCLWLADAACLALSLGLLLISRYVAGAGKETCMAGGFFTLFGILDLVSSLTLTGFTFCLIQSPAKMSQLSTFRWSLFLGIVLPQKAVVLLLSALPVMPLDYFDRESPYPLACFPIRQEGDEGATFGAILFFIVWIVLLIGIVLVIVLSVRYWAGPDTRVHASSPSLWQMQKMEQARTHHKFTLLETGLCSASVLLLTVVVYTNTPTTAPPQWVTFMVLAALALVHVVVGVAHFVIWSVLCGDGAGQKKEPHHRLKQLQLIRTDGRGRLRMKATWAAGKGVWRRGLLKVYGPAHIKAWAQEIVVLGLLRKSQSASVLQCLWTSNTNPYFETMTLISGDIVTSDSRLTCLELTSSGTLQDLLKNMDVPLPEPCQRTIMHDIAEGLSYLHDQNVLHRNLTSAAVYIKGSVKCFVLRAAVGDFEEAQIYGTLLTGSPNSTMTRKRFFFPDIRSYALVGIEMLAKICECRQRDKQPHRRMAAVKGPQKFSKSNDVVVQARDSRHQQDHVKYGHQHYNEDKSHNKRSQNGGKNNRFTGDECKEYRSKMTVQSNKIPLSTKPEKNHLLANHVHNDYHNNVDQYDGTEKCISVGDTDIAEYNFDQNWKLQMRSSGTMNCDRVGNLEKGLEKRWEKDSDNDYNPHEDRYKHSQIPGITNVTTPTQFHFPNNSIFRAASAESAEHLGIIEEEIERAQRVKLVAVKGSHHHQGGYITSKTEDGREIFIPASYANKSCAGVSSASSGYGSSGGGYSSMNGNSSYAEGSGASKTNTYIGSTEYRQVHKTASAATVSSFGDDILEVLPGMTDVEERPKSHGEGMLKELFKAKRDAKEEVLIQSYEERVRRGELGSNTDNLPDGVVFPKKNKDQEHNPTVEELLTGRPTKIDDASESLQQQQHHQEQEEYQHHIELQEEQQQKAGNSEGLDKSKGPQRSKNDDRKISAPTNRPKTAASASPASSIAQRMQRAIHRPLSASNTSFREWNARSSLKRNKARAALKRALSGKSHQQPQQKRNLSEERGSRAKEVEMKYRGLTRPGSALSQVSSINGEDNFLEEDIVQIKEAHARDQPIISLTSQSNLPSANISLKSRGPCSSDLPAVEESSSLPHFEEIIDNNSQEQSEPPKANVMRKPSTKNRPAPPPPPNEILIPITVPASSPASQPLTGPTENSVTISEGSQSYSAFDCKPQNIFSEHPDESFTSVEPASSSNSSSTADTNAYSKNSGLSDTTAEKIESDMNDIINSSRNLAAHQKSKPELPPGIRLIDSGFDSASISSEESCLCAAAALQVVDDGDASGPSEIFSQGTCSCACSNCLGSNARDDGRNGSSWTGSLDSETWSNSNSFSSYDANMHRRKLPSKREKEIPGCILAPDEQYPSSSQGTKTTRSHSLHPHTKYSPKRNHRRLSYTKSQCRSSASETSSVASRRYRELVKKGVPLRVSVVAVDGGRPDDSFEIEQDVPLADSLSDSQNDNNEIDRNLYKDLQTKGFFERDRIAGSLQVVDSPRSSNFGEYENIADETDERYQDLSPIPSLEDIIKEIPDETGQFSDETKAFLNRPDSELSIKALQAVLSRTGSSVEDKTPHSGELIIDRIFTHQGPSETMASTFGLTQNGLDLDVSAIREVALLPGSGSPHDLAYGTDIVGLLPGMDGRHVTYCHRLSSQLCLVNITDLLPAAPQALDKLRHRLQQTGRIGRIGNQILDTILASWLSTTPPTSAMIVGQLSDHITETEL
ncbi:leucine-rich repeat serine/threonine-protein kinase 2 [Plakobranchus ocellatus]|uniref:Leucine-rich repeat serine/threonine-protein kinase 2 n=1 Tax=Plakobranchus ocellatus TaxID=259542 RepID=A0AAV4C471_9GAST|nr:leucine-rich repeat serine/threonine-protein kinase 2 [Plakobranchus ocellatus]